MGRKIFVTATDTGSGKTYVTARLVRQLLAQGVDAIALKPVACGCDRHGLNEDVKELIGAQGGSSAAELNLYTFAIAASPNIASVAEGTSVERERLLQWCNEQGAVHDITLIEGVGGLMVPLTGHYLVGDWIGDMEECEVVLVVGARLGAINHVLLTLAQLDRIGRPPGYLVINDLESGYAVDIERSIAPFLPESCKLFRLPFDAGAAEFATLAEALLANR